MEVKYNVTGAERKRLARAVAEILGTDAVYRSAPTFAYEIGCFTVTRDGTLVFPEENEDAKMVLDGIANAGFKPGQEVIGLTVSVPLDSVNVDNLKKLLEVRGGLIQKALGVNALPIEVGKHTVAFPWFKEMPDADAVTAYTHLIAALCQMSREQNRINNTSKEVENEKYAFRTFLLRLGFIGDAYKTERKILLQNLSGSAAFRDGVRP